MATEIDEATDLVRHLQFKEKELCQKNAKNIWQSIAKKIY